MEPRHRWLIGVLAVVALAGLAMITPGEEGAIAEGDIIYVDVDAPAGGSGGSWADAYADLQEALGAAGMGVQIWVAEGTYKPTSGTDRTVSFQMKNGVEIYGGFSGTEGSVDDRDWESNVTVLSGDIGVEGDVTDNSYHVFYHPSELALDNTAVLDGFTISAGNASNMEVFPHFYGGGVYNYRSSPALSNCTFEGNSSAYVGGGMANLYSSPRLTNCTFRDNSADSYGGGMYNEYDSSSPTLTDCKFEGNSASDGGGMYNEYSASPTLNGCVFEGNSASSGWGGGMYNFWESSPVVTDCTFSGNIGGGMANSYSSAPVLTDCTFEGNSAGFGGGMRNSESLPTLVNCTFWGNTASQRGGGMYNSASSPTLINCTFSGNSAVYGGSGIFNWDYSSPVLTNCILWGHSYPAIENSLDSEPVVTYSDVEGFYPGVGNISADPQFVDAANGDFHLTEGSLCIDAGNNYAPNLPLYDFEGDDRVLDGNGDETATVDMGVDEVYVEPLPPPVIFVDADATGANTGMSWTDAFTTLQPALAWAVEGVEIWVAAGTYKPTELLIEGDARSTSFQMKNGVEIYGGFAGTEGSLGERNWETNETILSGDIGIEGDDSDNSYHVFYHPEGTGLNGSAVLDGFTITGGNANGGEYADRFGAGMYNDGSSPVLANCTFLDNSAQDSGGGMWNINNSSPALTNCLFSGNSAGWGGGMVNYSSSSPTLIGCIFEGNSAIKDGGGMWNYDNSSPLLTGCTFSDNSAVEAGGGIYNQSSAPTLTDCAFQGNGAQFGGGMANAASSPTLINCVFLSNGATGSGGGMFNNGSSPTLTNCAFSGNSAGNRGGGMLNYYDSSTTLTNCAFTGNSAGNWGGGMANSISSPVLTNCTFTGNEAVGSGGGGMFNDGSSPALTNCTFTGNEAETNGGGMYNMDSYSPVLANSILWGNSPNQIFDDLSSSVVTYCNIEGGYTGTGNIDADPQFVDAEGGDFHLGPDSPCIDVGSSDAPNLPQYDFEGDDRILDGDGDEIAIVDMGVDEVMYAGPPVVQVEIDVRPGSDQNPINLGSGGVVPVAILTTDEFDAGTVRPASVLFAGAAPRRWTREDVDRDGDEDLLLNFRIQELELEEPDEGSTEVEVTLTGETFPWAGGVAIEGTDTVRIIP